MSLQEKITLSFISLVCLMSILYQGYESILIKNNLSNILIEKMNKDKYIDKEWTYINRILIFYFPSAFIFLFFSFLLKYLFYLSTDSIENNTISNLLHSRPHIKVYNILVGLSLSFLIHRIQFTLVLSYTIIFYILISILSKIQIKYYKTLTWMFVILTKVILEYIIEFKFDENSFIFNTEISFNLFFLLYSTRIISYSIDYYETYNFKADNQIHNIYDNNKLTSLNIDHCDKCNQNNFCQASLQKLQLFRLENYNLLNYLCYVYYPALYFTGPIINYSSFIFQINTQYNSKLRSTKCFYLIISLLLLGSIEFLNYFINPYFSFMYIFSRYDFGKALSNELSLISIFSLLFYLFLYLILKYSFIWKISRCISLLDGIETEENISIRILTITSLREFNQIFNKSLYNWILKYIYFPFGGRSYKTINIIVIYLLTSLFTNFTFTKVIFSVVISLIFITELNSRNQINQFLGTSLSLKLLKIVGYSIYFIILLLIFIGGYVFTSYVSFFKVIINIWEVDKTYNMFFVIMLYIPCFSLISYIKNKHDKNTYLKETEETVVKDSKKQIIELSLNN